MFQSQIESVITILKNNHIRLKPGMTKTQIEHAQNHYEIEFPLTLKYLLINTLPVSSPFYDWTDFSIKNEARIKSALNWPLEGMLFDIEYNAFWLTELWGNKPENLAERLSIAEANIKKMPKLIPIYSHRYLVATDNNTLPPVLSVHQTDIIYYGKDLWDYFAVEFGVKPYGDIDFSGISPIPFWSDLIE